MFVCLRARVRCVCCVCAVGVGGGLVQWLGLYGIAWCVAELASVDWV
jgi:hypothetical protein